MIDVDDHTADLRRAYDRDAARRDAREPEPWRLGIVDDFVARVVPGARTGHVLELGCGTGQVAHRLVRAGLTVTAVDLSPTSTAYAVARGVAALAADFARLPFRPCAFGGALAFNSLLHVPRADLPRQFAEIRRVLALDAVLLTVTWGGRTVEGTLPYEWLDPPRYVSLLDDEDLAAVPTPGFARIELRTLAVPGGAGLHPQVLLLAAV